MSGKVLRAVREFFVFAGPAYHEESGQQGRSQFPSLCPPMGVLRVQAEVPLSQ